MSKIKVLIVDDQPVVRDGLKMILSLDSEIEVTATASNGGEALELCNSGIDVVLMDIRMPVMDGVKTTKLIKDSFPKVKIIILTTFNDDQYIFEALKNGASSYLLKDVESEEIINTVKVIYSGGTVLHSNIAAKLVNKLSESQESTNSLQELTSREQEVAKLVSEGLSNREIAAKLFIAEGTVKNHITNILSKLNLNHRTKIALYVIENNL
ncbi:MAG: Transcriptional regulatory protein DegU [Firmicutes bacterium ADurb.Bin419]|nr:MAG: Transcriptional regulatory protein DegU [Firmicutes bacterium ADurb.Bin419]